MHVHVIILSLVTFCFFVLSLGARCFHFVSCCCLLFSHTCDRWIPLSQEYEETWVTPFQWVTRYHRLYVGIVNSPRSPPVHNISTGSVLNRIHWLDTSSLDIDNALPSERLPAADVSKRTAVKSAYTKGRRKFFHKAPSLRGVPGSETMNVVALNSPIICYCS